MSLKKYGIRKLHQIMNLPNFFNFKSKRLTTNKINPYFGIEISNIPSFHKIKTQQIKKIETLIIEHGLVILRCSKPWTESEQVKFTQMIGTIDAPAIYSTTEPSKPEILEKWPNAQQSGLQWHSDRSYLERPSHLSVFQMVETPSIDNKTSFLSLTHIYHNLPDKIKKKWANYQTIYATEGVMHPLFMIHPFNGNKTMYFDFRFAVEILDICNVEKLWKVKDINEVMQQMAHFFSEEKARYTHTWQKGDIIIADNYAISHKASISSKKFDESRVLIRTSTEGVYF